MRCPVRVHTGGNRAKPPQAGKARRPTSAGHRGVLCIRSAEFSGSGVSPPPAREWMADDYLKKVAPVATHLSSPTSATQSATSRHWPRRPRARQYPAIAIFPAKLARGSRAARQLAHVRSIVAWSPGLRGVWPVLRTYLRTVDLVLS